MSRLLPSIVISFASSEVRSVTVATLLATLKSAPVVSTIPSVKSPPIVSKIKSVFVVINCFCKFCYSLVDFIMVWP